ncbi:MAG TPA: DNA polymerase IV [Micropepsaceae bacterium]|nr:DNA polymerase IV [Micropepsaceae bacterium]
MAGLCRDCFADVPHESTRCPACDSGRTLLHPELSDLTIAHLDCDAFYAAVETRDDPSLKGKPLIVGGGGQRGVVATACYEARKFGVKSAMPMFQALKLCPHATVIRPTMSKYAAVAGEIRAMLLSLTPLVEPLSLDEAYLDLSGTARLHGMAPAKSMAALAKRIEEHIGITVSIGLSHNKFLAKLASELEKPRGFAVIGRAETREFLSVRPISVIRGVGPVLEKRLAQDGISRIGQLQDMSARVLTDRYGATGLWLHGLANGEDRREVEPEGEAKSVSAETTFEHDITRLTELEHVLWDQAERVSARAKAAGIGGRTVTLKLKTASFRIKTRSESLDAPTQLSDVIFRIGAKLLKHEATGTPYRLLGVGLSQIRPQVECDPPDLLDRKAERRAAAERAMDSVRAKFGKDAVRKGRSMRGGRA